MTPRHGDRPAVEDALAAVVRAATGTGVASVTAAARVEGLPRAWPQLAGALAALLHAEGLEVPEPWRSMDLGPIEGGGSPFASGDAVSPARRRAAATMLITDPTDRVLVVDPTYKDRWELPGGAVEADESPAAAARREIAEELGLDIAPGRLLALDHVPSTATRTEGLITVFDGGRLHDLTAVTLPPDELGDAAFVDAADLATYLPALQARRAHAALAARRSGSVAYLEDGHAQHATDGPRLPTPPRR